MNWTELLKKEMETAYSTTEQLMNKVDAGSLSWKPASGTNWMTVGQLLKHLSDACGAGCKAIVTGEWGLPEGVTWETMTAEQMFPPAENLPAVESVKQARDLLAKDKALALDMVEKAGEDDLANWEIAMPWAAGTKSVLGYQLLKMVQHLVRHQSQLFYYLKLQGKAVNTVDLWGQP